MSPNYVALYIMVVIVILGVLLLWFAIFKWMVSTDYLPLLPGCGPDRIPNGELTTWYRTTSVVLLWPCGCWSTGWWGGGARVGVRIRFRDY